MPIRLFERKESKYWYCEFITTDGNTHRRSTEIPIGGAKSRSSAEKAAEAFRKEIEAELARVPSVTLRFAVEDYISTALPDLKPNTQRIYTMKLEDVVAAYPTMRLIDVGPAWIRDFVAARRNEQTDIQIRKEMIALSSVINHAIAHSNRLVGAPEPNPFRLIDRKSLRLKDYRVVERGLTKKQLQKLYDVVLDTPDPFWRNFFEITVESGMRLEEVLGMKWEQVDINDAVVDLLVTTKTGKTRRVPISDFMGEAFARLDTRRHPTNPHVFVNPDTGERYRSIWRGWHAIRTRAGLPGARIHDLRHTFAKLSGDEGLSESDRMQIQGHTTEAVQRAYRGSSERIKTALFGKTPLAILRKRSNS